MVNALDAWAVLSHPTDVRNVGGAIRAVANYSWSGIRVVGPTVFDERDIHCFSSGSVEFVKVEFLDSLEEAVSDCQLVVGTSRRRREPDAPPQWPSAGLIRRLAPSARTAILFGTERTGLTRAELDLCGAMVHMPTQERFPSMNLAHAVACIGYELSRSESTQVGSSIRDEAPHLSAAAREAFFQSVYQVVSALGYPPGRSPRAFVSRLRRILHRANPNQQELSMFGGLFAEMLRLGKLADNEATVAVLELEGEQSESDDYQP